ncbi:hypothetical protein L596_010389 [Steinernema carpocapsae]|uniref:PUL domain-containing protein n=1 Tax=Steinernema carpocapsae TaxID=34508 RepID=A0A4U5PIF0_STECR|nr:hypothetical protein L596_010389 [Steinernema carpocapsae]
MDLGLCQIVESHNADVKAVSAKQRGLSSVGRDGRVAVWAFSAEDELTEEGHKDVPCPVNSTAILARRDGQEYIFAGTSKGPILCYSPVTGEECARLEQHTANVCTLHCDSQEKLLVSGSWDGTAVVWDLEALYEGKGVHCEKIVLRGHEQSVWAVATVPGKRGYFLTGSADKTIKLWNGESVEKAMQAPDIIRAIQFVSPTHFYALCNTGIVTLWDLATCTQLASYKSLSGEFMYAMQMYSPANGPKCLVVCGEGGNAEVWLLNEDLRLTHAQALAVPVASLWTVAQLSNDSLAFGANDGKIYVFSQDPAKRISADIAEQIQNALQVKEAEKRQALQREASRDVVTIKVALEEGQPSLELRYRKGTDPQITAQEFILENGLSQGYFGQIVDFIKQSIPEANNPGAAAGKKLQKQRVVIHGEVYDYALDVTLGGGNEVKIGYNEGEDYDVAAERFCNQNDVPKAMIPKLSQMLQSQFGHIQPSAEASDPLTGANRYIPEGNGSATGGTYDALRPKSDDYPLTMSTYFERTPVAVDKAINKLAEFNNTQEDQCKLDDLELAACCAVFSNGDLESHVHLISALNKGFQWPLNTLLPVVDVFRLSILRPEINAHFFGNAHVQETLNKLRAILLTSQEQNVVLTACRAICNAFKHPKGCEAMTGDMQNWMQIFVGEVMLRWANCQTVVGAIVCNIAVFLTQNSQFVDMGPKEDAIIAIILAMKRTMEEHYATFAISPDAARNLLRAIVSLLWGDAELVRMSKNNGLMDIASTLKDCVSDEEAKNIAGDIMAMTRAV